MILFVPVNIYLTKKTKLLQAQKLKTQDSRIKYFEKCFNRFNLKV
jgi:hypothetical protein